MHLYIHMPWKHTVEKRPTNATGRRFKSTFEKTPWKKSNKCNQCEYESSNASNLRAHLKTHGGEMQPMWLCIHSGRQIGETQWRKVKQMQPMWICILLQEQFEQTCDNTHWMGLIRKSVEFQRINMDWLTIGEKSKHFQSTFLEKRYILFNSFKLLQFLSLSLSSSSSSSPSSSFSSSSSSRPLLRVKIFSIFSANFRQKKCQAKLYNIGELHKRINYWCKII